MAERYRVTTTGQSDRPSVTSRLITYPADAKSLTLIEAAGGLSKLSTEERDRLRFKTVGPGEYCDDMPENAKAIYLARGWIERIESAAKVTQKAEPATLSIGEPSEPEPRRSSGRWDMDADVKGEG